MSRGDRKRTKQIQIENSVVLRENSRYSTKNDSKDEIIRMFSAYVQKMYIWINRYQPTCSYGHSTLAEALGIRLTKQ